MAGKPTTPTNMVSGDDQFMEDHMYRLDALKMLAQSGISHPAEADIKAVAIKLRQKDEAQAQAQQDQQRAIVAAKQMMPPAPNLIAPPPPALGGGIPAGPPMPAGAGAGMNGMPLAQVLAAMGGQQ